MVSGYKVTNISLTGIIPSTYYVIASTILRTYFGGDGMKLMILFILLLLIIIDSSYGYANEVDYIDLSNSEHGVITVTSPDLSLKIKLMVSSGGQRIFYNIVEEHQSFSLQFGNGNYSFELYSNISGDSYELIAKKSSYILIEDDLEPFLSKIQNVNWEDDMEPIIKAEELAAASYDDMDKLSAIYDFVINSMVYDYDKIQGLTYTYIPDIESVYSNGKGICYDYASLLAAMLRSVDIPAKVIKGYREGISDYHAWNEVYIDGQWITLDPTIDSANHTGFDPMHLNENQDLFTEVYEY